MRNLIACYNVAEVNTTWLYELAVNLLLDIAAACSLFADRLDLMIHGEGEGQ